MKRKRLLPGHERAQESIQAKNLLGITIKPGKNGAGIVKSGKGLGGWFSVAYHRAPSYVDSTPVELDRAFQFTSEFTVLIRGIKQNPASFIRHIQKEKETCKNEVRAKFMANVLDWAFPKKASQIMAHDLLIWAPTNTIVPESGEETAALYGEVINYMKFGSVIRSTIYGLPMNMVETRQDPATGVIDNVWHAAPRKVIWYPRYYLLPDVKMAYAFWAGVITSENIRQVLNMGDLLIHAADINSDLYCSAILRVSVPCQKEGPDFSLYSEQLAKLEKWEQRSGSDIRKAFLAFIPGNSETPSWQRHSVEKPLSVLKNITDSLRTVSDQNGTIMMGGLNGHPLFLNPWKRPGWLFLGRSKSGKSTLAAALSIQATNHILWFPITAGRYEGAPYWIGDLGGTIFDLNLPDSYTILKGNGKKVDKERAMEKQEELHILDKKDAEDKMHSIEEQWYKQGRLTGFPITFNVHSGDTVRLLNWYAQFLDAWMVAWKNWYEKYGDWALIVADNFSGLRKSDKDALLGYLPEAAGRNLGITLTWLISNGRNIGNVCWILTHSVKDLDYISSGLYGQIGLEIALKTNDYTMAEVVEPNEVEPLASNLNIRLPQYLKVEVERREPPLEAGQSEVLQEDGQSWPLKVSSEV